MIDWHSFPALAARAEDVQTPQTEDIHRQLEQICQSRAFRGSLRLTRFLRFVVETTLAGKSDAIKAYTIAVEALGRGSNFDPQGDAIVRVEAGRLRQALARYYGGPGHEDVVVIDLPRGTYVPVFHLAGGDRDPLPVPPSQEPGTARPGCDEGQSPDTDAIGEQANSDGFLGEPDQSSEQLDPAPGKIDTIIVSAIGQMPAARIFRIAFCVVAVLAILEVLFDIGQPFIGGENGGLFFKLWPMHGAAAAQSPTVAGEPIIFVEPVRAIGDRPPDAASALMIRERLFDALARYDEVTVVPDPPHEASGPSSASRSGQGSAVQPPYYRLSSTVNYYPDDTFTLAVRLIDTADGTVAWAKSYDRAAEQERHRGLISRDVAQTLLQQFGIIQAREVIKRANADRMHDSYRCILDANAYLRSFAPSLYWPARDCLEHATGATRPVVGVFVKLSRLYLRDYELGGIDGPPGDRARLDQAYRAVARAVEIKPNSAAAQFAMEQVQLARGDIEQAKTAGENALLLNPNDDAVILGRAALLILTGQIDDGLVALRQHTTATSTSWIRQHFLMALGSYLKDDLATAEMEADQIAGKDFAPGLMLDAIIATKNKKYLRAQGDIEELYEKYPFWRRDFRADIGYFLPDRDMADRIGNDFATVVDDLQKYADIVGSAEPATRP